MLLTAIVKKKQKLNSTTTSIYLCTKIYFNWRWCVGPWRCHHRRDDKVNRLLKVIKYYPYRFFYFYILIFFCLSRFSSATPPTYQETAIAPNISTSSIHWLTKFFLKGDQVCVRFQRSFLQLPEDYGLDSSLLMHSWRRRHRFRVQQLT